MSEKARPSWDDYFIAMATHAASRSTCRRRQVGAVIVLDQMVVATGYNGTPAGFPNCDEGGCERCAGSAPSGTSLDTCVCVHAEQNAIAQAARRGVAVDGAAVYVTNQPCLGCAKLLVSAGIKRVVCLAPYADPGGADLFLAAGITVESTT